MCQWEPCICYWRTALNQTMAIFHPALKKNNDNKSETPGFSSLFLTLFTTINIKFLLIQYIQKSTCSLHIELHSNWQRAGSKYRVSSPKRTATDEFDSLLPNRFQRTWKSIQTIGLSSRNFSPLKSIYGINDGNFQHLKRELHLWHPVVFSVPPVQSDGIGERKPQLCRWELREKRWGVFYFFPCKKNNKKKKNVGMESLRKHQFFGCKQL